jgi:hypothetical protein
MIAATTEEALMPDRSFRIPSPYPIGRGAASPRLWTEGDDLFVTFPEMAMDAMPKARLPGARDQEDDPDNIRIAGSPTEAAYQRLFTFLADKMSPDDLQEAAQLVGQLFEETSDNTNGAPAMAGDRRLVTPGYSRHFPNAHRLRVRTYG